MKKQVLLGQLGRKVIIVLLTTVIPRSYLERGELTSIPVKI